jgi:hypothetical protein
MWIEDTDDGAVCITLARTFGFSRVRKLSFTQVTDGDSPGSDCAERALRPARVRLAGPLRREYT